MIFWKISVEPGFVIGRIARAARALAVLVGGLSHAGHLVHERVIASQPDAHRVELPVVALHHRGLHQGGVARIIGCRNNRRSGCAAM